MRLRREAKDVRTGWTVSGWSLDRVYTWLTAAAAVATATAVWCRARKRAPSRPPDPSRTGPECGGAFRAVNVVFALAVARWSAASVDRGTEPPSRTLSIANPVRLLQPCCYNTRNCVCQTSHVAVVTHRKKNTTVQKVKNKQTKSKISVGATSIGRFSGNGNLHSEETRIVIVVSSCRIAKPPTEEPRSK